MPKLNIKIKEQKSNECLPACLNAVFEYYKIKVSEEEIIEKISKNSLIEFLTTDLTEKFQKLGSVFFGCEIEVKKVDI